MILSVKCRTVEGAPNLGIVARIESERLVANGSDVNGFVAVGFKVANPDLVAWNVAVPTENIAEFIAVLQSFKDTIEKIEMCKERGIPFDCYEV